MKMPFSLSNTNTVVADDIFLLQNVDLKNIYDIFATIEQLNAVTGFDQATIDILNNIANQMGNLPSTWYVDLINSINLKRNISDSYSITDIDTNFYDKTYINSNFYDKTYIDNLPTGGGGGGNVVLPQHTTTTAILEFANVDNIGNLNTLKIIGGVNINITDDSNNSLMDFSQYIVEVLPPFKCYSTAQIVGNLTAPNIYDKTEIDNLLSALSSNILATDSHVIRCAKIQFTDVLNVGVTNLDIVGGANITVKDQNSNALMDLSNLSIDIHPPLQCYSSVTVTGDLTANNMYNKTEIDNFLNAKPNSSDVYSKTETNNLLDLKRNIADSYTKTQVNDLLNLKEI